MKIGQVVRIMSKVGDTWGLGCIEGLKIGQKIWMGSKGENVDRIIERLSCTEGLNSELTYVLMTADKMRLFRAQNRCMPGDVVDEDIFRNDLKQFEEQFGQGRIPCF